MSESSAALASIAVEVDEGNVKKDMDVLDIQILLLSPTAYREYKNLGDLCIEEFDHEKVHYRNFSPEEQHEIIFKDITMERLPILQPWILQD